jgi:pyruvate dehydrogenase E2 component (dihydrolipoamide acetyltransferase)
MKLEIRMPIASHGMESGKVVSWIKSVGDAVLRGEPIVEIETDKAAIELEAEATGVLSEIVHAAGAEVPVRTIIGDLQTYD